MADTGDTKPSSQPEMADTGDTKPSSQPEVVDTGNTKPSAKTQKATKPVIGQPVNYSVLNNKNDGLNRPSGQGCCGGVIVCFVTCFFGLVESCLAACI